MELKEYKKFLTKNFSAFFNDLGLKQFKYNVYACVSDNVVKGLHFKRFSWGDMTVTAFVIPLFRRNDSFSWYIGKNLSELKYGRGESVWKVSKNDLELQNKMIKDLKCEIVKYGMPFLEKNYTAKKILESYNLNPKEYEYVKYDILHCAMFEKCWSIAKKEIINEIHHIEEYSKKNSLSKWDVEQVKTLEWFYELIETKRYDEINEILMKNITLSVEKLKLTKFFKL